MSGRTARAATASIQFAALVAAHAGLSLMAWLGITLAAAVVIVAVMALILARLAARRRVPA